MILAEHRERPIIAGTGGGADAQGHLPLDHHRNGGKAPGLNEGGEHRRGDVIGKIGTGNGCKAGKLVRHKGGQIQLHGVPRHHLGVGVGGQRLGQNGIEGAVQLNGRYLGRPPGQLHRQRADAGADLQHAGIRACAGGLRDVPGYPALNEKVLAHAFGEAEAVAAQQGADVLFIA